VTTPRKQLAAAAAQAQMSNFLVDYIGLISVKSYGAKGDGVTNDTQAILDTVEFATENGLKSIFFPHGTYLVDAGLGNDLTGFFLWGDNSTITGDTITINQIGTNITEYNDEFTGLIDTPSSFSTYGGQIVAVKSDETGLEFVILAADITSYDSTGNVRLTGNTVGAVLDQLETLLGDIAKINVNVEVAEAHTSAVKSKTFDSLKDRLEESEQDHASHMANSAVYVSSYAGVDKTGETDSSVGFQNAVNAAKALKGKLIVSPGTYVISDITIDESLIIEGFGEGTILKLAVGSDNMFNVSGIGKKVTFCNLVIDGNYTNQVAASTNVCIYADVQGSALNPAIVEVEHCIIKNVNYGGVTLLGKNDSSTQEILNVFDCAFLDAEERPSDGNSAFVRIADGAFGNVENSYFDGGTSGYSQVSAPPYGIVGVVVNNTDVVPENRKFSNLSIRNNRFYNMGSNNYGVIHVYIKGEKVVISDNTIVNCYTGAIIAKSNSKEMIITDNQIEYNKESGIILNTWIGEVSEQKLIVKGNIIKSCDVYGISVSGWDADLFSSIIASNNIIDSCATGMYFIRCDNITIDSNIVLECTSGISVSSNDNKNIIIINNTISRATVGSSTKGIYVDDNDATVASYAENVKVIGNILHNHTDAIYLSRCKTLIEVSHNTIIVASSTAGVNVRRSTGHVKIHSNYLKDITATYGICVYDTNVNLSADVIGNTVVSATNYGYFLRTLDRLILEGNGVNTSQTGFYVRDVSRAIITGNNSQNYSSANKFYQTIAELVDANNSWNGFTSVA
jgi:polygalacturonase